MFNQFNMKQVVDVLLADLIVKNAGSLVSMFAPSLTTGIGNNLLGGGVAFLAGSLLKKPLMANAGIALAVSETVQGMIAPILGIGTTGTNTIGAFQPRVRDYSISPAAPMPQSFKSIYN